MRTGGAAVARLEAIWRRTAREQGGRLGVGGVVDGARVVGERDYGAVGEAGTFAEGLGRWRAC